MHYTARIIGFILFSLSLSTAAQAETTICTQITSSYTISAPGIYCLSGSISGSIQINASDVEFDLNGHALDGLNSTGTGIYAVNRNNITVRNGTIRGFQTGVQIDGKGSGHLFEHLRVMDNGGIGISMNGSGSIVRNNAFLRNGGNPGAGARWAIRAVGTGVHVHDNEVVDTGVGITPNEVVGINVSGTGVVVERNVVSNTAVGSVNSRGIAVLSSGKNTVVGNRIVNTTIGILSSNTFGGTTLFMDNTVGGAPTPFIGGIMAGSTNYSF
jgi:parallel beta-helix repeat protein